MKLLMQQVHPLLPRSEAQHMLVELGIIWVFLWWCGCCCGLLLEEERTTTTRSRRNGWSLCGIQQRPLQQEVVEVEVPMGLLLWGEMWGLCGGVCREGGGRQKHCIKQTLIVHCCQLCCSNSICLDQTCLQGSPIHSQGAHLNGIGVGIGGGCGTHGMKLITPSREQLAMVLISSILLHGDRWWIEGGSGGGGGGCSWGIQCCSGGGCSVDRWLLHSSWLSSFNPLSTLHTPFLNSPVVSQIWLCGQPSSPTEHRWGLCHHSWKWNPRGATVLIVVNDEMLSSCEFRQLLQDIFVLCGRWFNRFCVQELLL